MKYELTAGTAFPLVEINLDRGETIKLERGAMVYHNGQINLEGKMNSNGKAGIGGVLSALGRSMTSGESFFISQAQGLADNAKIAIAPLRLALLKNLRSALFTGD